MDKICMDTDRVEYTNPALEALREISDIAGRHSMKMREVLDLYKELAEMHAPIVGKRHVDNRANWNNLIQEARAK